MALHHAPDGLSRVYPAVPLIRALQRDAPFASFVALAHLPEHPWTTPATRDLWERITLAVRGAHPLMSELSFDTMRLWYGSPEFTLSRIGGFVVVGLHDIPLHTTLIALPGARTSSPVVSHLADVLRSCHVRLLSEPTVQALAPAVAAAGVDAVHQRDADDYVLSMDTLATLEGRELRARRREVGRLERRYGDRIAFRYGDLAEPWAHEHLAATTRTWIERKFDSPAAISAEVRREWRGIIAWGADPPVGTLRVFGLTLDGAPVAASVVASMWGSAWMGVVMKSDPTYPGLTAYLRRKVAEVAVRELGTGATLNIAQDDGFAGLRHAKLSYRPIRLLPKYAIARDGRVPGSAA